MLWLGMVLVAWSGPDGRHEVVAGGDCSPVLLDRVVSAGDEAFVVVAPGQRLVEAHTPDSPAAALPFELEEARRLCDQAAEGGSPLAVRTDGVGH